MRTKKSDAIQTKHSSLTLQVMDDLTVQLYTNPKFDFLMDTKTVANGYGVSCETIRSHKMLHADEIKNGIHYTNVSAVENFNSNSKMPHNAILWTKSGVIRLGFFIKSERAKAFRDWAEQIVLEVTAPPANLPKPKKRNHNRLTQARLVEILADVAKIEDREIRLSLIEKLGV